MNYPDNSYENSGKTRTFSEIQARIDTGDAVVLTAEEITARVRAGEEVAFEDVDVVTTATRGIMSGTYAVFSFKVSEPDSFVRASEVYLNGIPAVVGPCPNERLGVLDLIVLGTAHSKTDPRYGGGHLFRDLVEGKTITVDVKPAGDSSGAPSGIPSFSIETALYEMPFARLYATRHAFKNYKAFVNPGKEPLNTIFHALPFEGEFKEMTFCGCGALNPLENDPELKSIGIGTRVLINGAEGFVTGPGTRSSAKNPNLAGFADLHDMNPDYMGGFVTSGGPEIINTWAVPVPILNPEMLKTILRQDREIPLQLVDLAGRLPLCEITYGDVWDGADLKVRYKPEACLECENCEVDGICPMGAITKTSEGKTRHNPGLCFNCGLCVSRCPGGAFKAELGAVRCTAGGCMREIKVTLRQSDRARAVKAAKELKEKVLSGEFRLKEPVEKIGFD
ncbi:MAG: methanogenesis marker 16 metalloprotein [Methanosarcinaceae archaeon]|nr:methanogenesis marker 16 metalloprotein [Methanosarcinaceae archaeon]